MDDGNAKWIIGIQYINKNLQILQESAVPIIKLNYGDEFYFQQDNSAVHKAKLIKKFLDSSRLAVMKWSSKYPDLNIIDDIWQLISDRVYDGPQFLNKIDLQTAVGNAIMYTALHNF